jgi:hypothetical protein
MIDVVRRRITYANTMATVAVLIALGGSSYAAAKVTGRNVKDGSLTGADVRNSSLKSKDIRNRSLRAVDFRRGVVRRGRDGEDGVDGADGFDGFDGEPGPGITLASGRVNRIASSDTAATLFGGTTGTTRTAAGNETDVQVLSPADDATASDLSVVFTRYPCDGNLTTTACGDPGSATVTLRVDGVDTPLACTITTPDTACDSGGASAEIHAGSRLALKVSGGLAGSPEDRDMLFGLALHPPD